MTSAYDDPVGLRLMAAIQDQIAEKRRAAGKDSAEHEAKARQLRVRADLIEQGIDPRRAPPVAWLK
jgi:hypothetical protein